MLRIATTAAAGIGAMLILGASSPHASAAPPRCKPVDPFPGGLRVIEAVRVVKGADGESAFVPLKLTAGQHAYFRPGEMFGAIDFKGAKRVQIVSGPANVKLPYHASLAYEMFLTIQGESTVVLPNGDKRMAGPGTLVIMEDMGSKTGHAGLTGPCGYVAIQIVPQVPLP